MTVLCSMYDCNIILYEVPNKNSYTPTLNLIKNQYVVNNMIKGIGTRRDAYRILRALIKIF